MLTKTYNQKWFFLSEPLNLSTNSPHHNVILMRSETTVKLFSHNYLLRFRKKKKTTGSSTIYKRARKTSIIQWTRNLTNFKDALFIILMHPYNTELNILKTNFLSYTAIKPSRQESFKLL